jgi:hypothetical protein
MGSTVPTDPGARSDLFVFSVERSAPATANSRNANFLSAFRGRPFFSSVLTAGPGDQLFTLIVTHDMTSP